MKCTIPEFKEIEHVRVSYKEFKNKDCDIVWKASYSHVDPETRKESGRRDAVKIDKNGKIFISDGISYSLLMYYLPHIRKRLNIGGRR